MSRKEINVFSVSFLDLLSGALGAVLILFIIIPKMTTEQQTAIEELERLQVEAVQLEELLEQARNSIPVELYEQIEAQMEAMRQTIEELTNEVQQLQQRVSQVERENVQLREQLRETEQQLAQVQQQLAEAQRQLEQQQQQRRQQQQQGRGGKIFGVDAKLGVVCQWTENVDVDLYVKNLATQEVCFFSKRVTTFGTLNEDITSRAAGDDRYEFFYQQQIVPGRYSIWVNIYSGNNPATVEGHIIMFPGESGEQKIPYSQIRIPASGRNYSIGVLTVTETQITLTNE
jgi:uncharacterized protein (DUF3084 family)